MNTIMYYFVIIVAWIKCNHCNRFTIVNDYWTIKIEKNSNRMHIKSVNLKPGSNEQRKCKCKKMKSFYFLVFPDTIIFNRFPLSVSKHYIDPPS